jgi:hypothetical protein
MAEVQDYAVTKTYSVNMVTIAKVSALSIQLGISQGEVVRRAVELYYQQIQIEFPEEREVVVDDEVGEDATL